MAWTVDRARRALAGAVSSSLPAMAPSSAPPVAPVARQAPPRVSLEDYQRAWAVYRQKPTPAAVSAELGISWPAAEALVTVGVPDLGMPPLRDRLRAIVQESLQAEHAADVALLDRLAAEARAVQTSAFGHVLAALQQATEALAKGSTMTAREVKDLWAVYEAAGRYASFASGGPDSRSEALKEQVEMTRETMLAALLDAGLGGSSVEPGRRGERPLATRDGRLLGPGDGAAQGHHGAGGDRQGE